MHVRGQIRAYVAGKLSAVPGLQDHVTIEAADVPDEADLPWALISIGDESITSRRIAGPSVSTKQQRDAAMTIDIMGRDRQDVAEQVETIAARIEALLGADPLIGGLAKGSELRALTVERVRRSEGSQPMLVLRLQYQITYMTAADAPEVAI